MNEFDTAARLRLLNGSLSRSGVYAAPTGVARSRSAVSQVIGDRLLVTAARIIGAVLVCAGVILAVGVAVATARDHGKPVIDVSLGPAKLAGKPEAPTRTYLVDAHTKATNLPAKASVTILVDGLRFDPTSRTYAPTNVFHGKYGPNNEGVLDIHAKVDLTRGTGAEGAAFDAFGVQAAIAFEEVETPPNPCGDYAKKVSTKAPDQRAARERLDPGCVVTRLPGPVVPEETQAGGG